MFDQLYRLYIESLIHSFLGSFLCDAVMPADVSQRNNHLEEWSSDWAE